MLQEFLLSLLVTLGIMNPTNNVQTAFTLFREGHYKEACQLIKESKYGEVKQAKDAKERSLLQAAVYYADTQDVIYTPQERYLKVEHAIDTILEKVDYDTIYVNSRDKQWQTVLMTAVQKGYHDVAKYVYLQGGDPRIKDIYGKMARDYAVDKELRQLLLAFEWETYDFLRLRNNLWSTLKSGAYSSAYDRIMHAAVSELINARDLLDNSFIISIIVYSHALSYTLSHDEKEQKVLMLLNAFLSRVDQEPLSNVLDVQNQLGQTALMWAAKYGYKNIIAWLHTHGANVLYYDAVGRKARDYTKDTSVQELLEDIEMIQEQGWRGR